MTFLSVFSVPNLLAFRYLRSLNSFTSKMTQTESSRIDDFVIFFSELDPKKCRQIQRMRVKMYCINSVIGRLCSSLWNERAAVGSMYIEQCAMTGESQRPRSTAGSRARFPPPSLSPQTRFRSAVWQQ